MARWVGPLICGPSFLLTPSLLSCCLCLYGAEPTAICLSEGTTSRAPRLSMLPGWRQFHPCYYILDCCMIVYS